MMVWPPIVGIGCPPLKLGHNPLLDQLVAAIFNGLACGPDAHKAGHMGVVRLKVIDHFVLGSL